MGWGVIIGGVIGLLFRLILLEGILPTHLKFERRFLSRLLAYYTFLAMTFNFQSTILNLIVACSFPMMILMIFVYDIPFFIRIQKNLPVLPDHSCQELTIQHLTSGEKWAVYLERITLHSPMVVLGLLWYLQGLKSHVFPHLQLWQFIVAMFLVFIPFLTLDQRITKKKDWPEGLWLFLGGMAWLIGFFLHFFVFNFA